MHGACRGGYALRSLLRAERENAYETDENREDF